MITRFFWGSLIEPRSNQNQTRAATALYADGFVSVPEIEVEKTDGLKGPKLPVDAGPIRNFRAEILSVFLTRAGGAAATVGNVCVRCLQPSGGRRRGWKGGGGGGRV